MCWSAERQLEGDRQAPFFAGLGNGPHQRGVGFDAFVDRLAEATRIGAYSTGLAKAPVAGSILAFGPQRLIPDAPTAGQDVSAARCVEPVQGAALDDARGGVAAANLALARAPLEVAMFCDEAAAGVRPAS